MTLKTYQEQAKNTNVDLSNDEEEAGKGYNDILHMLLGMQTELGELTDVFKKNLAYGKGIDWINVAEEIGDLSWYIANFCNITGIDWETQLTKNIEKLKIRYPDKFSAEKALNRDLKAERETLE